MQHLTYQPNNRETWLNTLTRQHIAPHFESKGYTIPDNIRFSCSFSTKGAFRKKNQKTIVAGQCISPFNSGRANHEIIIVPSLPDTMEVVSTLVHELVHATVDHGIIDPLEGNGHKSAFKQCAESVGLTGQMTSTVMGEPLKELANQWLAMMGDYPHEALNLRLKKQSTRNLKCVCKSCGYTLRTSSKWLKLAIPKCPLSHGKMIAYDEDGYIFEVKGEEH